MKYQYTFLVLLVAFMSSTGLYGRTAKILYFKAPKDAPQQAFLYQENEYGMKEPINAILPRNNFSSTIELIDEDIKIYFLESAFVGDMKDFPENAPSVTIPAAWEKVLIFAQTDSRNPILPIKCNAVNANEDKLTKGDLMFINSSDSDILGVVGNKKLNLKAKSIEVVKKPGPLKSNYGVKLDRVDKKRNITVTFIRQSWQVSSSRSSVVFIYKLANSNRVTYYTASISGL